MNAPGQELDQGLEDMWNISTQGINGIDPGECETGVTTNCPVLASEVYPRIEN